MTNFYRPMEAFIMSTWKRLRCLGAAIVVLFAAMPMQAADEAKPVEKAKADATGLRGYYAVMAKELKLTDDQKKQLVVAAAARTEALAKWDEANGAKLAELTAASKKAKDAGDTDASKKTGADAKALRDARGALSDSVTDKLKSMLTEEQKQSYEGYNLYVGATVRFAAAKMDKQQKAKAKELAFAAAKGVTPDLKAKALTALKDELAAKVSAEVLTAEQREAVAKAAADKTKSKAKPDDAAPAAKPE